VFAQRCVAPPLRAARIPGRVSGNDQSAIFVGDGLATGVKTLMLLVEGEVG
jgi:hypothetical protein